jgi:hypothetical protein
MFRRTLATLAVAVAACLPAAADSTPATPFNGKDLSGWKLKDPKKSHWEAYPNAWPLLDPKNPGAFAEGAGGTSKAGSTPGSLVNVKGGGTDIYTEEKYGNVHLELEFMVPKNSNSGIYLMGEYEVQVLDSYGKPDDKLGQGDLGALYSAAAPKKNAAKKPGEWQKFVIDFQAPKFDAAGEKTANAKFVKVVLNDVVLHENVEMKQQTPGGLTGKEHPTGPLMFQGDHGAVAFRNIKITPTK